MNNAAVQEYLKTIKDNQKPKVPKEGYSNSMTTGKKPFSIVWRPNNYRRQIRVGIKTNSVIKIIKRTILNTSVGRHNKLLSIKDYRPNITIQYGKEKLTAIYSQSIIGGNKQTFFIKADSIALLDERLNEKKNDIKKRLDDALLTFSKQFRIFLPFEKIVWSRHEDFIKGEEYIDSIPAEVIIHDTVFKKVYKKGIEFTGGLNDEPTVKIKNYIKNRAIEDIAPDLAKAMNNLVDDFKNEALKPLTVEIRTHLALLRQEIKSINNKKKDKKKTRQDDLRGYL